MKKLEELGISPAPWRVGKTNKKRALVDSSGFILANTTGNPCDACMLAAAPKMYAALWFQCFGETGVSNCRNCKGAELGNCYKCKLGSARSALVDASEKGV